MTTIYIARLELQTRTVAHSYRTKAEADAFLARYARDSWDDRKDQEIETFDDLTDAEINDSFYPSNDGVRGEVLVSNLED